MREKPHPYKPCKMPYGAELTSSAQAWRANVTNTYAINVTRGKEFEVEGDLEALGLSPWVPRQLCVRHVKGKTEAVWYDRPYVGKLLFCVFPAVCFRDVCEHKHVVGKPLPLTRRDINGVPAHQFKPVPGDGPPVNIPAVPGLKSFQAAVQEEYDDMRRRRENSEWVCGHKPGDALRILKGPFEGFEARFIDVPSRKQNGGYEIRVEVEVFGRATPVQIAPDLVEVS